MVRNVARTFGTISFALSAIRGHPDHMDSTEGNPRPGGHQLHGTIRDDAEALATCEKSLKGGLAKGGSLFSKMKNVSLIRI